MTAKQVRQLCGEQDELCKTLRVLKGKKPTDKKKYYLYPPAEAEAIARAEKQFGFKYPPSYRAFLKMHNGWLGFWPDWSLVGIPRPDNATMYKDIKNTQSLLPVVADNEMRERLPQDERTDSRVMLITNHLVLGTDFNGSLLLFDRNRVGKDREPQIAWVHYIMHVERRWTNFEELLKSAIQDTKKDIAKLQSAKS